MRVPLPHGRRPLLTAAGVVVVLLIAVSVTLALTTAAAHPSTSTPSFYRQTNLNADLPGAANGNDPSLVNPWGLSRGPTTPMTRAYGEVARLAQDEHCDMRMAAYMLAIRRVADATLVRGIYP